MARILFIDDDEGFRKGLTRYLIKKGHSVTSIPDFRKVCENIDPRRFDIIFLDLCFPDISGSEIFSLLHLVQGKEDFEIIKPPPVVVITGYPQNLIEDKLLALKVFECLIKPVSCEEIDRVIDRVMDEDINSKFKT